MLATWAMALLAVRSVTTLSYWGRLRTGRVYSAVGQRPPSPPRSASTWGSRGWRFDDGLNHSAVCVDTPGGAARPAGGAPAGGRHRPLPHPGPGDRGLVGGREVLGGGRARDRADAARCGNRLAGPPLRRRVLG